MQVCVQLRVSASDDDIIYGCMFVVFPVGVTDWHVHRWQIIDIWISIHTFNIDMTALLNHFWCKCQKLIQIKTKCSKAGGWREKRGTYYCQFSFTVQVWNNHPNKAHQPEWRWFNDVDKLLREAVGLPHNKEAGSPVQHGMSLCTCKGLRWAQHEYKQNVQCIYELKMDHTLPIYFWEA